MTLPLTKAGRTSLSSLETRWCTTKQERGNKSLFDIWSEHCCHVVAGKTHGLVWRGVLAEPSIIDGRDRLLVGGPFCVTDHLKPASVPLRAENWSAPRGRLFNDSRKLELGVSEPRLRGLGKRPNRIRWASELIGSTGGL